MRKTSYLKMVCICMAFQILFFNNSISLYAASTTKNHIYDAVNAEFKFYDGDFDEAADFFENISQKKDRNFALCKNQLGSIYLAKGDYDKALDSFLQAYYLMNDVSAFSKLESGAVSLFGDEAKKGYKGDPYEKVYNALYVSLLLYKAGDYENALAAIKTGILADSDVEGQLYRSDSYLLYIFASRLALMQSDASLSKEYLGLAQNAYRISFPDNRTLVSIEQDQHFLLAETQKELEDLLNPNKKKKVKRERKGSPIDIRSATKVPEDNRGVAIAQTKRTEEKIAKLKATIEDVEENIKGLIKDREKNNTIIDTSFLSEFINKKNNTFLILELGKGPVKYPIGQYGQLAVFTLKSHPVSKVNIVVDKNQRDLEFVNTDTFFQAQTRGGRQMDAILKGQAQFKQATADIAIAFSRVSQEITNQANQMVAANPYCNASGAYAASAAFALIGLCIAIASDLANPAADVRHWSLLPGNIVVKPLNLKPGIHKVEVECIDSNGKICDETEFEIEVKDSTDNIFFKRIL